MRPLTFDVPGVPVPQAEVVPGNVGRSGKRAPSYYANGKDLHPWRDAVTTLARHAAARAQVHYPKEQAVRLDLVFWLPRKRTVTRDLPTVKPDVQHLVRAVEDALTAAGVWVDDAQVTDGSQSKRYADRHPAGVSVRVSPVNPAQEGTA